MVDGAADTVLARAVFPFEDARSGIDALYYSVERGVVNVIDAATLRLGPGSAVSLGTYFAAFPAAYWAHWAKIEVVRLRFSTRGEGAYSLMRSDAEGNRSLVETQSLTESDHDLLVPLDGFDDGGWLWIDFRADGVLRVSDLTWESVQAPVRPVAASVGITTYNRPEYCLRTLERFASSEELLRVVTQIYVVDQGEKRVEDDLGADGVFSRLKGYLTYVRQENLGGSGGYARAMSLALAAQELAPTLLLDDDVDIDPEALRRAIVFASFCTDPTIVGGHMFDLLDRTKLYAWAEVVDRLPFMWHARDEAALPVDLGEQGFRDTPLVHRRADADYNGWWMCLIPREALRTVGLPMPYFIKWDDAEYSLRAAGRGIPTVTFPGAALWHISWVGKDDLIDWQAYFHARNRIVTALLHSPHPGGGSLLTHSRRVDMKHLMSMQYYPVELRHRALRAVLAGPEHLPGDLARALPEARALVAEYPEASPVGSSYSDVPRPTWADDDEDMPRGIRLRLFMVLALVLQWTRRPRRTAASKPEVAVPAKVARWWRLARYDSALVTMAATGRDHFYVRDRAAYRRYERESRRLHRELRRRWPELAERYRAADLASPAAWRAHFAPDPHLFPGSAGVESQGPER